MLVMICKSLLIVELKLGTLNFKKNQSEKIVQIKQEARIYPFFNKENTTLFT